MYFKLFLEFGRILGEADVKETMSVDWKTIDGLGRSLILQSESSSIMP